MQMVLPSMTNMKAASRKAGKTSGKIKKVSRHHEEKNILGRIAGAKKS